MAKAMSYRSREEEISKGFQGFQHRYKVLKDETDEYNRRYESASATIKPLKVRLYNAIQEQRRMQFRMTEITEQLPKIADKIKYCEGRLFEAERRNLENQDFSQKLRTVLRDDVLAAERELQEVKKEKIDTAMEYKKVSAEIEKKELKVQKAEKRQVKAEETVYVLEQRLQALHRASLENKSLVSDNVNEVLEQQVQGLQLAVGRQRDRCRMAEDKIARLYSAIDEKEDHINFAKRRNMELASARRDLLSSKLY